MGAIIFKRLLSFLWKLIPKWSQWYLLWLLHPKFNIGVSGIIFNDNGKILLLKHVHRTHFVWGLPSGWVKRNETIEKALKREIFEETGLEDIEIDKIVHIKSGFKFRIEFVFIGHTNASKINKVNLEIFEAAFFELFNLLEDISPEHRKYISNISS